MAHKLKKGVTIKRDYHPTPLLVNSYGSELNQVWTNIIDNAVDAMHGEGELRIRTFLEGDCAVVEIGDSGPGIPPDIQSRIFEPFFTTKGVGEGTGLGLDTTLRIVRKHRGSINVTSVPGDTGFRFDCPLWAWRLEIDPGSELPICPFGCRVTDFAARTCSNSHRLGWHTEFRNGLGCSDLAGICDAQERTCIQWFKTCCYERRT